MPPIEIEPPKDIVEARVVLTVTRLNDILRVLIDQSNVHDRLIEELRHTTQVLCEKAEKMELALDALKPDGAKQRKMEDDIATLFVNLQKHTNEVEIKLDTQHRHFTARHDAADDLSKKLDEEMTKETSRLREANSKAHNSIAQCHSRLDSLHIPDISPLLIATKELNDFRESAEKTLAYHKDFVKLWGIVPPETLRKMYDDVASGAICNPAWQADYLLTLAPFQQLKGLCISKDASMKDYVDGKHSTLTLKIGEKADRATITTLSDELKEKQLALQQAFDFVNRRIKDNDALVSKVAALEEKEKELEICKVSIGALAHKADEGAVSELRQTVGNIQNDLNDVFDKMAMHRYTTPPGGVMRSSSFVAASAGGSAAVGPTANVSSPKTSTAALPSAATTSPQTATVPSPLHTHRSGILQPQPPPRSEQRDPRYSLSSTASGPATDEAKRHFADIEHQLHLLEKRKANREELTMLHEYVEETEARRLKHYSERSGIPALRSSPSDDLAGRDDSGTAQRQQKSASRRHVSPHAQTSPIARYRSPPRDGTKHEVADIMRSLDSAEGTPVGNVYSTAPTGTIIRGRPPGSASKRDLPPPPSNFVLEASAVAVPSGAMEANAAGSGAAQDVRVKAAPLGRSVVTVRDSSGGVTAAAIALHQDERFYSHVEDSSLPPAAVPPKDPPPA